MKRSRNWRLRERSFRNKSKPTSRNMSGRWIILRSELDSERDRIRQELIAELESDRYDLETQRLSWTAQRDEENSQIERDREINEEAFGRAELEIKSLRGKQEERAGTRTRGASEGDRAEKGRTETGTGRSGKPCPISTGPSPQNAAGGGSCSEGITVRSTTQASGID